MHFTKSTIDFLRRMMNTLTMRPAKVPPQGRWRICGLHLPDASLRKVYNENAMRELGLRSS